MTTLPPGSRIGKYQIVSMLGQGGFGITYRARDTQLDRDVAIKEYLPTNVAARQSNLMVVPHSTQLAEDFHWGRDRFLTEAKTLAHLESAPGVVNVYDFLEANGTAYMVMALVPGETLEAKLRREGRLTQASIEQLLFPLLEGLERVHQTGFLHRDIKPANILIDRDGAPALIDFGASRVALQDRTQAMTAIYTPGYAAFEQMSSAPQGPWTDIYALAGTLYHCVTGAPPPPAVDRMTGDRLVPAVAAGHGHYAPGLLAAIDAGLVLKAEARPQSIAQWRTLFPVMPAVPHGMLAGPATRYMSDTLPPQPRRSNRWLWLALAAVMLLCLAGGVGIYVVMEDRARLARDAAADETAWTQAKSTNTVAGYQAYLTNHPLGRHAAEARQAVAAFDRQQTAEVEAWARTKASNTEAGYRAYLDRYPAGRYAAEAHREIERLKAPAPRQAIRDCDKCPEMLLVSRGSFLMGAAPGEEEREGVPREGRQLSAPQRTVTFDRRFALGKYLVTRGEFAAFVAATGHDAGNSCHVLKDGSVQAVQGRNWRDPVGAPLTDGHPVLCISIDDARAYAAWLSKATGRRYRLPSEAEWEYAARAGTTTTRYWGDGRAEACRHQNVADFSFAAMLNRARDDQIFHCLDGHVFVSPVDAFPPNPWGFHDMLGNAYQRLSDCWHPNYQGAPTDGRSWEDGGDCALHVVRGGSWYAEAGQTRAAQRYRGNKSPHRTWFTGFRVARDD